MNFPSFFFRKKIPELNLIFSFYSIGIAVYGNKSQSCSNKRTQQTAEKTVKPAVNISKIEKILNKNYLIKKNSKKC